MNRGEAIDRVGKKLRLNRDSGSAERTLMANWYDDAIVEVLLETGCRVEVGDMALTVGVDLYRVDVSILAVKNERIMSGSQNYTFEVVPWQRILDAQRGVGAGTYPSMVAFEGTLMMVWPAPQTVDTIRFLYVPRPSATAQDTDSASDDTHGGIPSEYHRALEYYMLWQGAEYDATGAPMTPKDYHDAFYAECARIKKRLRARRHRGLTPAVVGYPGRQSQSPRRNDVYPG